jgi:hypothetical protein
LPATADESPSIARPSGLEIVESHTGKRIHDLQHADARMALKP